MIPSIARIIRRIRRALSPRARALAALRQVVDAAWYRAVYPDVAASGQDPGEHFVRLGAREGRRPNRFFDPAWYVRQNPGAAGCNPVMHYGLYGRPAGRDPGPLFSVAGYLATHPDVARNGMDPLEHYIRHGRREGRTVVRSALPDVFAGESPARAAGDLAGEAVPIPGWMEDHPVFRDETVARIHAVFAREGEAVDPNG